MNRVKKVFVSLIAMFTLLLIIPTAPVSAAWRSDSTGYWYTIGNSYLTGWQQINGVWYYFYSNGYMAHDCWIGNYYVNSQGAWTLTGSASVSSASSTAYNNNKTQMVYVASSGKGKKYHSNPNCSRMKGARQITLSQAQAEGYTACSKCC